MRTLAPSHGAADEIDPISRVVLEFEEAWRSGPPPLDRFRARFGADEAPFGLAELVKADLQNRYRRCDRPGAREYLDRFPELAEGGRAISLIYEEYCLRVEADGPLDTSEFCRAYPSWRDSLVAQLAYHRDLSRAVEPAPDEPALSGLGLGDRFGEYELIGELGQGGWARVFLARSEDLGGKSFALKVSPDRGSERSILGVLDHAHIVPVFASVVDPATGLRGLCMPFRPGLTLNAVIRRLRVGGLPRRANDLRSMVDLEPDAPGDSQPGWSGFPDSGSYADAVAWVGLKVAQALAHAHSRGFVHRDVKPENILLNGRDGPLLIDFNLALDPDSAESAREASRGGTLPYMAPEQLRAFLDPTLWGTVDGRADLFSLGLVLSELLTKVAPRPSDYLPLPQAVNAMILLREAPQPPIRRANPDVPHALAAIVAKCLAPMPAGRHPSATALADDLARYLSRRPLAHAKNPSRPEVIANTLRRRRAPIALAAVLVAIAVPCTVLLVQSRGARDQAPTAETGSLLDLAAADEAGGRLAEADRKIGRAVASGDAIRSFEAALGRHPTSIAMRMGLALSYERGQYRHDAERAYRDVLDRDPTRIAALSGLAKLERMNRNHAEAAGLFGRCIASAERLGTGPERASLPLYRIARARELLLLGDRSYDGSRFAEAAPHFRGALDDLAKVDPRRIGGEIDRDLGFDLECSTAMAKLGLGRVELCSDRPGPALKVLGEARMHARRALALKDFDGPLVPAIEAAIREATRAIDLAANVPGP